MKTALQRACAACLIVVCACVQAVAAEAQFPSRPVRLIVAVPPAGAADVTVRIVAQKLTSRAR